MIRAPLALLALLTLLADPVGAQLRTRNVVLIVTDGLRWQELFRGAERALISNRPGGVRDTAATRRQFWREGVAERRQTLMPFFWGTIAREGVLLGNRDAGHKASITNTMKFSYPGYNEILTGRFDPRIDSNEYPPNPNVTVFEWLARDTAFRSRVGAVATWDAFRRIFNRERAGIDVIDGWDPPFTGALASDPRRATINEFYRTTVRVWANNAFDSHMHMVAKEYIRARKPRVLFLGYGETDEWAHNGTYDLVLQAANRVDGYIRELWDMMQSMPEYRGSTTFIITTDHGRGSGPDQWRDHGKDVDGAEHIWIALLGPDITPRGVGERGNEVTQAQVAATVAALLGRDYRAFASQAAPPLPLTARNR